MLLWLNDSRMRAALSVGGRRTTSMLALDLHPATRRTSPSSTLLRPDHLPAPIFDHPLMTFSLLVICPTRKPLPHRSRISSPCIDALSKTLGSDSHGVLPLIRLPISLLAGPRRALGLRRAQGTRICLAHRLGINVLVHRKTAFVVSLLSLVVGHLVILNELGELSVLVGACGVTWHISSSLPLAVGLAPRLVDAALPGTSLLPDTRCLRPTVPRQRRSPRGEHLCR